MLKHKQRSSKHARADLTWGTDIKMQVGDLTFLQALNASPVIWKKRKEKKKGKVNIPLLFLNAHYLMSTGNADLILLWQKGRAKDSLKCLSRFFPFPLTRTLPLCVCVCVRSHKCSPLFEPFDNNNDSGKDYHSWPLLNFKVKGALQLWLCVYQRKANDELISYGLRLLSPHLSEDLSHPLSGRMLS